jgi:ribosomal protein S18 acetylase RimI-like enzyme
LLIDSKDYIIYLMTRSGAEISPVESGEELVQAWKECGFDPPGGVDAWAEAVEADRNGVLVARLSATAVGFVTVKWSGPSVREPEVTEALTTEFPDEQPIPTIYSLNVQQQHRRKGIGWDLMVATEHAIIDRPGTVLRSALSVQTNNKDGPATLYIFRLPNRAI